MEPFILHNHVVQGARKLIGRTLCLLHSRGPTSPSATASTACSLRYNNSSFIVVQKIISNSCGKNVHREEAFSCPGEPHWHQQGPKSPRWRPIHFNDVAHSAHTQKVFDFCINGTMKHGQYCFTRPLQFTSIWPIRTIL